MRSGELQLICLLAFHAHARRGLNSGGGAGRKAGSICIGEHYLGPEIAAVIRSRGMAAKRGFLMYYSKGDAIGTRVVSAIEGVVAYQRWSLRGVPLYFSDLERN